MSDVKHRRERHAYRMPSPPAPPGSLESSPAADLMADFIAAMKTTTNSRIACNRCSVRMTVTDATEARFARMLRLAGWGVDGKDVCCPICADAARTDRAVAAEKAAKTTAAGGEATP